MFETRIIFFISCWRLPGLHPEDFNDVESKRQSTVVSAVVVGLALNDVKSCQPLTSN